MVNTGRPSGACGVCRERRIKCDETKPACLKCIRSGRSCSGYSHGLKLRDQTQKTIIKAKLGKSRGRRQGNACQDSPARSTKTSSSASSTTEGSLKDEPVRARSFSLPSRSASKNGGAGVRGHKRRASGPVVKTHDFWSLDILATDDAATNSLLWHMIDIPLVVGWHCRCGKSPHNGFLILSSSSLLYFVMCRADSRDVGTSSLLFPV